MRKPNYTGRSSGNGKPFKRKAAPARGGSDRESFRNKKQSTGANEEKPRGKNTGHYRDRDKDQGIKNRDSSGNERPFKARKTTPFNVDDKLSGNFSRNNEKSTYAKRDDGTKGNERESSRRKTKPRKVNDQPPKDFLGSPEKRANKKNSNEADFFGKDKFSGRRPITDRQEGKGLKNFDRSGDRFDYKKKPNTGRSFESQAKPREGFNRAVSGRSSDAKFDSNARKYAARSANDERPALRKNDVEGENIKRVKFDEFEDGKVFSNTPARIVKGSSKNKTKYKKQGAKPFPQSGDGLTRLNKYLASAGIASRREADTLIQSGVVKVNGVVVDQLGYKISPGDKVTYGDAPVKGERKVYLLLNKPKDYITTVDDPQERKTVMELISKACRERIYPVGRLDRNTTGLLLFTNDGELTTRLTHPKFGVKKVYHVSLNKGLKPDDFKSIVDGLELEDGIVKADDLAFVGEGKKEIGIEIHSGRNRIVRRIFEHLGYDVLKLDRVVFAGLTKKDLPRGKHRFLTAKEISFLQMIG